jgi:hypothetical protein
LLSRDVGEVRDAPHVTTETASHSLVGTSDGDALVLWDTPGFGDSARLVRRLRQQGNPVGWFLSTFDAFARCWVQEFTRFAAVARVLPERRWPAFDRLVAVRRARALKNAPQRKSARVWKTAPGGTDEIGFPVKLHVGCPHSRNAAKCHGSIRIRWQTGGIRSIVAACRREAADRGPAFVP